MQSLVQGPIEWSGPLRAGSAGAGLPAADPVGSLEAAAEALADLDPAHLGDGGVADAAVRVRRALDRVEASFARLARAAHVRGVGSESGASSTAAWLSRQVGMRSGDARAALEAGALCELLPDTGEAWLAGDVNTAAVRTIAAARLEDHDELLARCESTFLGLARAADMRGLRRAVEHFRNLAASDGTAPPVPDGLHVSSTYAGRTALTGDLGGPAGETVVTALHAYTDPPSEADRRPLSRRHADALVRICEVALAQVPDGQRSRGLVNVVVDWATLTEGRLGRADGQFTGPMPLADVRRLLCDCSVSRVATDPEGLAVDVGRRTRTIPAGLRRALVVRDQGCRFPGCERPAGWCDGHHVHHWLDGGPTDRANVVLACGCHHRLLHRPGWTARFDGVTLRIRGPDGIEVT